MPSPVAATAAAFLFLLLAAAAEAANFTCTSSGAAATCRSALGYVVPNATTYSALMAHFNVSSISALLGANNLPLATSATAAVHSGATVRIPFPCRCHDGVGQSDHVPVYTVKKGDGLDAIARNDYGAFVTYQEIATANNIRDVNVIQIGQELWIPLPCSCDGEDVEHLAYSVPRGDSTSAIAAEFGVDESTLLKLNDISDPKNLQAGQILDVPLRVCKSSISKNSPDHDLRVPNGTYALTARNCIQCSCSSNSYQLDCISVQSKSCPAPPTCNGTLSLGHQNASGCAVTTCAYNGFSNSTPLIINAIPVTNQSLCSGGGSAKSEFFRSNWGLSLVSLNAVLIWMCFL